MNNDRPVAAIATIGIACLLTNYGSFWQHYALRRKLSDFGFKPFRVADMGERVGLLQVVCDSLYGLLVNLKRRLLKESDWVELTRQGRSHRRGYWKFREEYRRLIGEPNECITSLPTVAVTGGDQVFSDCTPEAWLRIFPDTVKKFSYSASVAWTCVEIKPEWCRWAKRALTDFSSVGVREEYGKDFLLGLLDGKVDIEKTPDPVLLLTADEWKSLLLNDKIFSKRTLFVYMVSLQSYEDLAIDRLEAVADALQAELKICGIQGTARFIPDRYVFVPSPTEFLRAIRDCCCFITNSFHGTVFSSVFNRNFIVVKNDRSLGNVRIEEFLADIALESLWLPHGSSVEIVVDRIREPVDWKPVNKCLSAMREKGGGWIEQRLKWQ